MSDSLEPISVEVPAPIASNVSDVEAIRTLMWAARKAARIDLGSSDDEIEYLRDALSIALTRWPEITTD